MSDHHRDDAPELFVELMHQGYAVVLLQIVEDLGSQRRLARTERVLRSARGVAPAEREFAFISCPGHWGQATLQKNERAIVFLTMIHGRLYELHWRGHLVIERFDEQSWASLQHPEMWTWKSFPPELRGHARAHPSRSGYTAFELEPLERYLERIIQEADATPWNRT